MKRPRFGMRMCSEVRAPVACLAFTCNLRRLRANVHRDHVVRRSNPGSFGTQA
jgi:hypothetical protein